MSNPLILHGSQIALPKPRPLPVSNSMPCIPEATAQAAQPATACSAQSGVHHPPEGSAGVLGVEAAPAQQAQADSAVQPFRSASNTSMFSTGASQQARSPIRAGRAAVEGGDSKDRMLNADERLKRLKLRMQHTIQAYSGTGSSAADAGRYKRTQSLTAAQPHAAYHRTNSSPVRPSRVGMCKPSQRAPDESNSCHSSSSCSSAATPASLEGASRQAGGGALGGRGAEERLGQTTSMPSQRGIPQVYYHHPCVLTCVADLYY